MFEGLAHDVRGEGSGVSFRETLLRIGGVLLGLALVVVAFLVTPWAWHWFDWYLGMVKETTATW